MSRLLKDLGHSRWEARDGPGIASGVSAIDHGQLPDLGASHSGDRGLDELAQVLQDVEIATVRACRR